MLETIQGLRVVEPNELFISVQEFEKCTTNRGNLASTVDDC